MVHDYAKNLINAGGGAADSTRKVNSEILAVLLGGLLLVTAAIAYLVFPPHQIVPDEGTANQHAQTIAMIAALLLGVPLVWQAVRDLWVGHMRMNELAALAVTAAFANGQYLEAGAIAFFMIITSLIEHRTALGARKSIEALVRITPTRAHLLSGDGEETEVEAKDLKPGDIVRVRPGDNIPGDGRVVGGVSTVNQANITGESLPVDKAEGDEVFGGTINDSGVMEIEITKAGEDTTLGRVKDLILQAERTRTPISRLIDRYAHWYTPVILLIITAVYIIKRDLDVAISMLIIACPCAFILAVPTAMVAALSSAARLGVLVKDVATLETARNLTAIVFDKTGTLTTGKLSVTRLNPVDGVEGGDLLLAAASVEQNSRHPVARAIVEVARRARLDLAEPSDFEEVSGRGVRGSVNGQEVLVGRATWIAERGIDTSVLDESEAEGLSLLYVSRNGKLLGWVGLEDKSRVGAADAMDRLREDDQIRKLVMVTGDRWSVARRVAGEMHCTDVQAEVLPGQKLEIVDDLKSQGHTVAVVGDGVNDAPALAAGNISIAMGAAGSDVAINSASIALMNNNLNRIPFLVELSRDAITVVRQNLIFAMLYIVVFEIIAGYNLLPPVLAVLFHTFGSVLVVFNSARLVRKGEVLENTESTVAPIRESDTTRAAPAAGIQPVS